MNQNLLIGRLNSAVEKANDKFYLIFLKILDENKDGNIPVHLSKCIAEKIQENCENNACIGIKGYLTNIDDKLVVIAEKVTFLSHSKN